MNHCLLKNYRSGFTLIELIGVLTIIAILASVIVPNLASQITRSTADAEDKELNTLARSLEQWVQQNRRLPLTTTGGTNGWDVALSSMLSLSPSSITQSMRTGSRRLILDPGSILTNGYNQATAFANPGTLGSLPTAVPTVRYLMVSHLDQAAPAAVLSAAEFQAVWTQTNPPAAFAESEVLRLERINLSAFIYPVAINLISYTTHNAHLAIDGSTVKSLGSAPQTFSPVYLFHGTQINLVRQLIAPPMSQEIQAHLIITTSLTLTFDGHRWYW